MKRDCFTTTTIGPISAASILAVTAIDRAKAQKHKEYLMKRSQQPLTLHRETVRRLTTADLVTVAAADGSAHAATHSACGTNYCGPLTITANCTSTVP